MPGLLGIILSSVPFSGLYFCALVILRERKKMRADSLISDMLFSVKSAEQHSVQEGEQGPDCCQALQIL